MRSLGNTPVDGEVRAVASGTLPSGQPVIVNANGTVSVAGGTPVSQAVGSNAVFEAANTTQTCAAYDAYSNKMVIVFIDSDDGAKGKAVVGTISGTSITFGATATWHANGTNFVAIVYHAAAQKVVIAYYDGDNSGYGTSVVGSVSGTNISFGSTVIFNSENTSRQSLSYDSSAEKVVLAYRTTNNVGKAQVGTVSGTNVSWGTAAVYNDGGTGPSVSCAYDINANKTVVVYKDENNSSYGTAIVGSVSGTNISFGSEVVFETATTDNLWVGYDSSSQKVVISYRDRGNSDFGTAIVGSVSGTSISFGTAAVFEAAATQQTVVIENTAAGFVNIFYRDNADSNKGKFVTATVSGTSLTFSAVTSLTSGGSSNLRQAYDSTSEQMVFVYKDQANSSYGTAVVVRNAYTPTNLTAENYIGMSQGVVVDNSITQSLGTPAVFNSGNTTHNAGTFDSSSNKIVLAYSDGGNSNYGTAIVGTVSGNTISFGTEVVFESANSTYMSATFDSNSNKVVIAYGNSGSSGRGTAVVGTVSGNSISFGTPVVFDTGDSNYISTAFDSSNNKVVISYSDSGNSVRGTAVVGTVSGTSISFGTPVVFNSGATYFTAATFDSNSNKVIIAYRDNGGSPAGSGYAIVGTVSGTGISFGTEVQFRNKQTQKQGVTFDSNSNKVVISYFNDSDNLGEGIVGTVSGTSISFGTPVVFNTGNLGAASTRVTFDSTANKVVVVYEDDTNSDYGTLVVGTVSGTSIIFGTKSVFESANVNYMSATFDSNAGKVVITCQDEGNSGNGTVVVFQVGTTNITRGQVASGSSAIIDSGCAISTNQLSLTAGQQYFVQTDGTLGLTAADPSVLAGTAVSATKLIVKG